MDKSELRDRIEKIEWLLDMHKHLEKGGELELYKNWSEWRVYDMGSLELTMGSDPIKWRKKPLKEATYPKAETEPLKLGTEYFIPFLHAEILFWDYVWDEKTFDYQMLERGLVHLKTDNAIQQARVLLGIKGTK